MSEKLRQVREPDPRARLSLDELARVQSVAAHHLTFSLTLACPLKCAHCIVDAGPERASTTMPLEVARHYADQMKDLYAYGIHTLSFTGGEPLVARQQLRMISDAAAAAGMSCGVVTAAYWATRRDAADRIVSSLPGLHVWDLSIDAYHEPFVSFDRVRTAYEAVKEHDRTVSIRFSYHDPLNESDKRILEHIHGFAKEAEVCSQKIRKVGRGVDLDLPDSQKFHPWTKPCITQGMVVRYDGSIAPCCVNLVEERRHPFQLGDARSRPLTGLHSDYISHPLLQMLRTIGFLDAIRWLGETDLLEELVSPLPDDVCDLCPKLLTSDRIGIYLSNRAARPENRIRIAVLASRLLGDHEMLRRTVHELRDRGYEFEGFEAAIALAEATDRRDEEAPCRCQLPSS